MASGSSSGSVRARRLRHLTLRPRPGWPRLIARSDNAIYALQTAWAAREVRVSRAHDGHHTSSFEKFAALESGSARDDQLAVAKSPPDLDAAQRLSQTVRLNAQLRNNLCCNMLCGGHAENALPQPPKQPSNAA